MNEQTSQTIDSRVAAFVGHNAQHYDRLWKTFTDPDSQQIKFNFAAAFFSAFWLLYRKLYLPFGVLIAVISVDVSLTIYLEETGIVSPKVIAAWDRISPFVYGAVVGTLSNTWYYNKFRRVDKESLSESPDPAAQVSYLQKKGGVSFIAPVGFLIATILFLWWAMQPAG